LMSRRSERQVDPILERAEQSDQVIRILL